MSDNSEDEPVGYGRPPKATRFRKGKSGNPRGRPKGVRNADTEWREELKEKIEVVTRGVKRTMSKRRALMMMLMSRAMNGDPKFAALVFNETRHIDEGGASIRRPVEPNDDDKAILKYFEERVRREIMAEKK